MQDRYHQDYPDHQTYPDHQSQAYQTHQGQAYPGAYPAEPPLDPAMEKVRRKMMRLLAVSIGIMLVGLMAVLAAVVYKINQPSEPEAPEARTDIPGQQAVVPETPPAVIESQVPLAPGTRLLSQSISGDLVSLETLLPDGGTEIVVYDYKKSRIVARMRLGPIE
ncbi:hypothetical protein GCM10011491_25610 [Brucella endophytica]|uniref:Fimbrial protein n=1 Tax=Brucella endophytica TaxID=1963359 RepID=A0A916WGR2_9HYPH|nr:hypothetical protein [Brucella endophytica]GGA96116.1 hypothetical protein GCM10011491_25610 [Brucella endophytica]